MKLDEKTLRLIAIGASITANCQQCLQVNIIKARENGCDEQEINEAIETGRLVSRGAISKMNKFVSDFCTTQKGTRDINEGGCNCS